jgi:peptidoglycan/LPS O-acetylase OafA/YrhL
MYPNLYFFLKDVFGGEPWGFTRYVNSFGFFVALAFVASGVILTRELRRKEGEGLKPSPSVPRRVRSTSWVISFSDSS